MRKKLFLFDCSYLFRYSIFFIVSLLSFSLRAQEVDTTIDNSAILIRIDSLTSIQPSQNGDSSKLDSVKLSPISAKKASPNAITNSVTYNAVDSIRMDIKRRKAYLYKNAVVYYEDMELQADYIEIDFSNNELYASGISDEEGIITGHPVFKQGEASYRAHEMRYNFTTKKGKITDVITTEGEGYIHGEQVKKLQDNTTFIKKGKYTTCELEQPHFEIAFSKAKVLPNDKIVTGPAWLSFDGVPTVLAIPFGFFPLEKGRKSGFVMPTIGESSNRGFYFENGGFYFGISDNFDLTLVGDVYTRGSWAAKVRSNYVFRYKCKGTVNLSFAQNYFGERHTESFYHTNDFKFYWDHQQDAKSNPTTRFSAHIDIVSRTFNTYNPSSVNDYLSNQYTSKLNFSTNAKGIFFLDASVSYSQNTQTGIVNLALPDLSMSVNQFYPFRKKDKSGSLKWYDNISLKWTSQFMNQISSYDSLLLLPETWENLQLGMKHTIPLNIPIKIAKLINWNTSVNLTEKWYLQSTEKNFTTSTDTLGEVTGTVNEVFKRNFYALHDLSMSTSLNTKVYFMYQFKKGGLKALRHVMTPNLSFIYSPNLSKKSFGTYFNTITGEEITYSYFDNSIFGGVSSNTQANAKISIGNNVEIKVRSRKDTITGTKKIVIFDNLNISTYYNFAADSLRWAPLTITGRSTLFRQLYITFSLAFDPYIIGPNGRRINQTELKVNKRLYRLSSSDISIGLNWTLDQNLFKGKSKDKPANEVPADQGTVFTENTLGMPNRRPDFNNPWSITLNYTFAYATGDNYYYYLGVSKDKYTNNIIQTFNVSGDINITKKWKVGFTTGYDFTQKDLSYTSLDIYRDLHCWEMRFNWIPFGTRKGWSFTINVKASVLQDVIKYNKKSDFRDNF